ncbi:hypothetical protein Fcan01_18711 [Folsomia candida]|uniref:Uncharacterized protein n=1 Tax=Folsomia candida TaxID=158441 RepID=A0A226DR03_FOLCA|nr:hypothetical protein Fcan01_18711 [Folsomia candida]
MNPDDDAPSATTSKKAKHPKKTGKKSKFLAKPVDHISVSDIQHRSDDDSSVFEMDENNLFICVNEARKVVSAPRASNKFLVDKEDINESPLPLKKHMVVIIRDFSVNKDSSGESPTKLSASKELKVKLLTHKLCSYIIGIPGLLADLQAINIMKGCTKQIPEMESETAYKSLLLAIIETKIRAKTGKVIIINLEDQSCISPPHLKSYCEDMCRAEVVFTLDKCKSASFHLKLEKLTTRICRYLNAVDLTSHKNLESNDDTDPKLDLNANELENNDSICTNNFSNGDDILTEEIPGEEISSSPGVAEPEGLDAGNEVIVDTAIIAEINNNDNVINVPLEAVTNDVETLEGKIEATAYNIDVPCHDLILEHKVSESDITNGNEDCVGRSETTSVRDCSKTDIAADLRKPSSRVRKKRRHAVTALSQQNASNDNSRSSSNSEESLHMSFIFAQRPKLLKIQLTADESRYPSSVFTRFPTSHGGNSDVNLNPAEANLYKGWVAVPTVDATLTTSPTGSFAILIRVLYSVKVKPKFRKIGQVMRKAFSPIGSLFSCEACTSHQSRPSTPQRIDYPRIMLESRAFDQRGR